MRVLSYNEEITAELRQRDCRLVEEKRCPRCEETLPLSQFGVCRSRKDGLNLYCKRCIREKIRLSRASLKDYKRTHPLYRNRENQEAPATLTPQGRLDLRKLRRKLSHSDRIIRALEVVKVQSFKELRFTCRLSEQELSNALADVVGSGLPVGSRNGTEPRVYFLKPKSEVAAQLKADEDREAGKPVTQTAAPYKPREITPGLSFSTIKFIMPSRMARR